MLNFKLRQKTVIVLIMLAGVILLSSCSASTLAGSWELVSVEIRWRDFL